MNPPPSRPAAHPRAARSNSATRRTARTLVATAALLALAGGGWYWSRASSAGGAGGWRTVTVERGDIRVAISATGTLSATSTVTVGSQISGQITEVLVDFNDKVHKDQVIARIDPSTYQAQIEQGNAQIASARAALAQAEATLRNAELDFARKLELGDEKLVAQSDIDLARAALEQARAQVASTRAQIRQQTASTQTTRVNLERAVIRSPVDGVVLKRSIEPGQTVAASMTAPELFQIAEDLSKMKIELFVDESDIGQVTPGQAVSFTADAFPERQFRGRVEQVRLAATTSNNVVTYPVIVSVDNSDGTLLPGLTVNAEIEVNHRRDVLRVASAALRYKPVDAGAAPAGAPGFALPGAGLADDLAAAAEGMQLSGTQRAALDAALEQLRARRQAMRARTTRGMPGGGSPPGARMTFAQGGSGVDMQAIIRQRMQQEFAGFTDLLDETRRQQWNRALNTALSATRATIYRLKDGEPEPVTVRVGASDGSRTEIAGAIAEHDAIITGAPVRR